MIFENPELFQKKMIFFSKIDEAWPNAPSLQVDAWFLKILIFFFIFKKDDLKKLNECKHSILHL